MLIMALLVRTEAKDIPQLTNRNWAGQQQLPPPLPHQRQQRQQLAPLPLPQQRQQLPPLPHQQLLATSTTTTTTTTSTTTTTTITNTTTISTSICLEGWVEQFTSVRKKHGRVRRTIARVMR